MPVDPVLLRNVCAWLRKAQQDFERITRCLATESPDLEDALFHCPQAAEKALKAFLTLHDQPFRKTHDLATLGKQCASIDSSLAPLADRLDDLTEYAWAYRYPTEVAEPTPGDIEEARRMAQQALEEISRRLPQQVREAMGITGDAAGRDRMP
ncbi:MAG: HEPN domain-containing protein [Acidobacteriota bacterium]